MAKTPQRTRPWHPKYGVQQSDAHIRDDGSYVLDAVRDFVYRKDGTASEQWLQRVTVRPKDVRRVWYILEPFTSLSAIAHPYFLFEYADGSTIAVTIEGKRLDGAPYSALAGMRKEYELGYVWITEKDCLSMPLAHKARALYLYPLTLTPEESAQLMTGFLIDTHNVCVTPEFYHTLFNNCTVRFARIVHREKIRHMPFDLSWHLPGWSDRYLARLGLIDSGTPLRDPACDLVARQDEVWEIIMSSHRSAIAEIAKKFFLR